MDKRMSAGTDGINGDSQQMLNAFEQQEMMEQLQMLQQENDELKGLL